MTPGRPAPAWAWWVATGLGSGRLRPAPGTWGSLAALLAWCLLTALLATPAWTWLMAHPQARLLGWAVEACFLALPLAMTWLAVAASDRVLAQTGEKDPGWIVADEWAGLWIALWPVRWTLAGGLPLLFTPQRLRILPALLVPFLLFRLLDIWKPWPVRQIQVLPGGAGVVADDVVAGLYTIPLVTLLVPAIQAWL